MAAHDEGAKLLFSHPEMVRDLLRDALIPERWVDGLDLSTLERVSASYVTDDLRERHDDIVWKVKWRDLTIYLYLLIEFQSDVDVFMAVRIMVYIGLLWQDLIRQGVIKAAEELPPVVPIVLYNGVKTWNAARDVADLLKSMPEPLAAYRPSVKYLLIDEKEYADEELASKQNLVAALFRLENSATPQRVQEVLDALIAWLADDSVLARDFTIWLTRVLRATGKVELPDLQSPKEAKTVLAERFVQWLDDRKEEGREEGRQEGREEGRQEGRQQGRQEGMKLGEATILLLQLEDRFGVVPERIRERIEAAGSDTLLRWCRRVLRAQSIEEVIDERA